MATGEEATYGLRYQARSVAAVTGQEDRGMFLVGTATLRERNEVHLLEYLPDEDLLECAGVFEHDPEVWTLAPSPSVPDVFATRTGDRGRLGAAVWRLPDSRAAAGEAAPLVQLAQLGGKRDVSCLVWDPSSSGDCDGSKLAVCDDQQLAVWQLGDAGASTTTTLDMPSMSGRVSALAWDPHHSARITTACDTVLRLWDVRAGKETGSVEAAHALTIRTLDYNVNKPWYMASGGDDGALRFWDLRRADKPLSEQDAHPHWLFDVAFNHFHDQLVLTCSSDACVKLWNMRAISSSSDDILLRDRHGDARDGDVDAAVADADGDDEDGVLIDGCVKIYDAGDDSIYSVAWSAVDPWSFLALGYDGRISMHRIPQDVKYKILL